MFCEAGHKMLHRARSLRKLRAEDMPSHRRQISNSSDSSRASSSGSDTSKRDHSVEWDSLRLHPSMEVDRSPHITPLSQGTPLYQGTLEHYFQDDHRYAQSTESEQSFNRPRHTQSQSTEIHDGFDFGFNKSQVSDSQAARRLRTPKSEADLHHRAKPAAADFSSTSTSISNTPSPIRRTHPRGFDEADYFIKRGGWKRRGIYFGGGNDAAQESEDDCFEIP